MYLYVIHVIISSKKHSTSLHPDTSWYQNNCFSSFSTSFKIAWAESPRALRHLTWSCVGQLVHSPQTVTFRAFINPFMVGWWQSNSCSSWSSWVYLGTQSHSALEALVQCDAGANGMSLPTLDSSGRVGSTGNIPKNHKGLMAARTHQRDEFDDVEFMRLLFWIQ